MMWKPTCLRDRLLSAGKRAKRPPDDSTGVLAAACERREIVATREVLWRGQSKDQLEAREGQAGRHGVAERFVVPLKLGNAGGGTGPQFKTDAIRGEGPGRLGNL